MMTGDRLGTGHDPSRGAAYISSWVEVLDKNPQEIVNASAEAQRMSNYLVSRTEERQQDPDRPAYIEEATQRAAERQQTKEPARQYRAVPVPHRPGVYRIQDAKDPSRPVPSPYGTMYDGKAAAEKAIERLRQDQKRGALPAEPVRAQPGVIVQEESRLPGGRPGARIASPSEGLVRGSGRAGVRQDQFPSRTAPER